MPDFLGFQFRMLLNLYSLVVFRTEHDFLFESPSRSCGWPTKIGFKFRKMKCLKIIFIKSASFDLLSFDEMFGDEEFSWLPSKNKVADENLH